MAKPALGRGLGDLLDGAKPAAPDLPAPGPPRTPPGLRALLSERPGPERPRSLAFLKWPLLLADVLLCVLAVLLVWPNPGVVQITLGSLAVLLGGWLACLAFWLE